jgi:DNA repair photolyase
VELIDASSIFSPATGFIQRGGFDFSCNPYLGCTFGCSYCYAMFLPQNRRPLDQWGKWFTVKQNAVELAAKSKRKIAGKSIYLSSVTDPYQPVERTLCLTRGILQAIVGAQPRLLVQTRGSLVVRDIDLLRGFERVRVNVSISTDSERVREQFEPKAPALERRWQALAELKAAGIPVGICVTPMLPIENPTAFAAQLLEFSPGVLVVQDFHDSGGGFGADTGESARRLLHQVRWTADNYRAIVEMLRRDAKVYEGEEGFFPP